MSNNHYDTLESIFSIPEDVTISQKDELISITLSRIKSTVSIVEAALSSKGGVPADDISNSLWMVEGQLEQLEKLIKFEVKE